MATATGDPRQRARSRLMPNSSAWPRSVKRVRCGPLWQTKTFFCSVHVCPANARKSSARDSFPWFRAPPKPKPTHTWRRENPCASISASTPGWGALACGRTMRSKLRRKSRQSPASRWRASLPICRWQTAIRISLRGNWSLGKSSSRKCVRFYRRQNSTR